MTILHPQEYWLLERVISPEYYRRRFEGQQEFVELCERQVTEQSKTMPLDVHRRPLYKQIDVVWDGRALPNIRSTLKSIQYDFIQLQRGDLRVLQSGGNTNSDMKGLIGYPSDWMSLTAQKQYDRLEWRSAHYNNLIRRVSGGYQYNNELTYYYEENLHGPLALPMQLPLYKLDSNIYLHEDDSVTVAGLYLLGIPDASAQLLCQSEHIPEAWQGRVWTKYVNEARIQEYHWESGAWAKCNWKRIRRMTNRFINVPPEGFSPQGMLRELYSWPQCETQYVTGRRRIAVSSGEARPHSGEWSIFVEDRQATVTLEQGEQMPEWTDRKMEGEYKRGEKFHVPWSLMNRHNGGSVWVGTQRQLDVHVKIREWVILFWLIQEQRIDNYISEKSRLVTVEGTYYWLDNEFSQFSRYKGLSRGGE